MLSALFNHGQRIGADASLLLAGDGSVLAGTLDGDPAEQAKALEPLLADAGARGNSAGVVVLDGAPYLLAIVPVMAPQRIGWVAMGKRFGAQAARAYRTLTGLDAAIVVVEGMHWRLVATSLAPEQAKALASMTEVPHQARTEALAGRNFHMRVTTADPARAGAVDVILLADVDDAMQPYQRLKQQILLLTTVATALVLLVSVLVGRSVAHPVARLAAATRRIESGDYAERLPVVGNDEFADLASAFNRMQDSIAEREMQIRYQAQHDSLTGLPNRMYALAQQIGRAHV